MADYFSDLKLTPFGEMASTAKAAIGAAGAPKDKKKDGMSALDMMKLVGGYGALAGQVIDILTPEKTKIPAPLPARESRPPIAALGVGIKALSSEKAKENIEPASTEVQEFLDSLHGKKYNYNEESGLPRDEKHIGVMAEDIEQSELGEDMVEQGENDRFKKIAFEPAKFGQLTLAVLDHINKRLKKLEGE